MDNLIKSKAIKAALSGDWKEAIKLNLAILDSNASDCETLNRLALAYKATGNIKKTISTYQKVLKIDQYNAIANRNLDNIKNGNNSQKVNLSAQMVAANASIFLEEPGKTKMVSLVNLAPFPKINGLYPTESLALCVKRKCVFVIDENENYIGALPDDISYRLMEFMQHGYKYNCFVKSVGKKGITVLIRESERGKDLKNQPTFPIGTNDHEFAAINSPVETHHVTINVASEKEEDFAKADPDDNSNNEDN